MVNSSDKIQQCSDLTIESPVWTHKRRPLPSGVRHADWDQVSEPLRQAIVDAIQHRRWPVYMHGIQGCGKSSAMACVYRAFSGKARWILLEPFVQQILKCRRDGRVELFSEETGESFFRTEEKWFRIVEESQLLCIDDIGLRSPTDAGYEIVFKLINAREDRPTFYTSNHGESDVARVYGRRISSRLLGGTVITCTGVDRREQRRVRVTA